VFKGMTYPQDFHKHSQLKLFETLGQTFMCKRSAKLLTRPAFVAFCSWLPASEF
jgi:hypothetical protein